MRLNPFRPNYLLVGLLLFLASAMVMAEGQSEQAPFPNRPITLVVGFSAGGGTDSMARAIAEKMEDSLGVNIIVENVTGAAGGVAATEIMRSDPDGYTIGFVVTSTFAMETLVSDVDYSIDDFTYLGMINIKGDLLLARADLGYDDFEGMIERAKSEGFLRYGTIVTGDRIVMQAIADQEGFELDLISAGGGSATRAALLAGDAEVIVSGTRGLSFADDNAEIQPIAALTADRVGIRPDLPTLNDLGYDLELNEHHVFFAPPGLPGDIRNTLEEALQEALADPDVRGLIERLGHEYLPRSGAEAAEVVADVQDSYRMLLERIGN